MGMFIACVLGGFTKETRETTDRVDLMMISNRLLYNESFEEIRFINFFGSLIYSMSTGTVYRGTVLRTKRTHRVNPPDGSAVSRRAYPKWLGFYLDLRQER
jgi:hypothetical protein